MNARMKLVVGVVGLLAVAVAAWAMTQRGDEGASTATVQRGEFRATVEATGSLEAEVAFEIGPPSVQDFWQYNLSWMIPEGSRVKAGEVLARFDGTELENRMRVHRAALETALQEKEKEERNLEVQLRQMRLDLVKAEGDLKELDVEGGVPEGLLSSIEVNQLKLRRELAQRKVDFLREKIEFQKALVQSKLDLLDVKRKFAEGKISYTEDSLRKFNVRAPVDGLVVYIPKRNGDRWEVGEGIWMLAKIMKVADLSTLRVEASVLEVDAARLSVGQTAEIRLDAMPGVSLHSSVAEIGRMVHERSLQDPSKVFDAILPLQAADLESLRPGMGAKVSIETSRIPDSLTVPLGAVRATGEEAFVEVVSDGSVERRAVKLGERNTERVVVQEGLAEGDVVLLPGAGAPGAS